MPISKVVEYLLIQENNKSNFTSKIHQKLDEGFILYGPPAFLYDGIKFQYIQALILEEEITSS